MTGKRNLDGYNLTVVRALEEVIDGGFNLTVRQLSSLMERVSAYLRQAYVVDSEWPEPIEVRMIAGLIWIDVDGVSMANAARVEKLEWMFAEVRKRIAEWKQEEWSDEQTDVTYAAPGSYATNAQYCAAMKLRREYPKETLVFSMPNPSDSDAISTWAGGMYHHITREGSVHT